MKKKQKKQNFYTNERQYNIFQDKNKEKRTRKTGKESPKPSGIIAKASGSTQTIENDFQVSSKSIWSLLYLLNSKEI
jgi:hypothetical protein